MPRDPGATPVGVGGWGLGGVGITLNPLFPPFPPFLPGFAEIIGERENVAHIYGKALDVLGRNPNLSTVVIKFVSFSKVLEGLPGLKTLTQLASLTIANSDISSLAQISHLGVLTQLQRWEWGGEWGVGYLLMDQLPFFFPW